MNRKILTMEDLVSFCKNQKMYNFSSSENGKQIVVHSVQDFSTVTYEEEYDKLFAYVKVCHTGLNRNGSFCSDESMKEAMPSLAYSPFLAYIHQTDDGEWNFYSHNGHMEENEDGEEEWVYDEKQVGTITTDEPYLFYDEDMDKNYVVAKVAIPMNYTRCADIIKRDNGCKVSCELAIDEMSYNAKEGYLELKKFYFTGLTALGKDKQCKEVGEGMLGSKLSLESFSAENNSIVKFTNRLDDLESKLDEIITRFDEQDKIQRKEEDAKVQDENKMMSEENIVTMDGESGEVDTDTTPVEGTESSTEDTTPDVGDADDTDEDDTEETVIQSDDDKKKKKKVNDVEVTEACGDKKKKKCDEEEVDDEEPIIGTEACGDKKKKKCSIEDENGVVTSFEISLEEKSYALNALVNEVYAEADNTWYGCTSYESYVVMHDYWNGRHYRQSYEEENDTFTLVGDRVEVYATYCTQEELDSLDSLKADYSVVKDELQKYKDAESYADKMTVFNAEHYADYLDTDEFKSIMAKDNVISHSKEELANSCELAFAKLVRVSGTFSMKEAPKKVNKVAVFSDFGEENNNPYGDYFKSFK